MYQVIVGLEIHAQLDIATKLFSSAPSAVRRRQTSPPNSLLHPFDIAVPGFLPVLSKAAVQKAVLAAAALNCQISRTSRFERKHYSYADLPHSYQITQQRWPLAVNGSITGQLLPSTTSKATKSTKSKNQQSLTTTAESITCRIERLQLECDTARTIVTRMNPYGRSGTDSTSNDPSMSSSSWSLVDFNRAGTALIEIVTAPDLRSSQQAATVVTTMRQLLQHAQICRGRMQDGQLRVDVNVNLQRLADRQRNARVEVKNLNSIQQVVQAIDYEALRQAHEWSNVQISSSSDDDKPLGETRTWDVLRNQTILIRKKDAADDYRFLPEPDLPPLILNEAAFDGMSLEEYINDNLPELPAQAIQRLQRQYGISPYQANVLASDPPAIRFLDEAMAAHAPAISEKENFAELVSNLLCNNLFALVNEKAGGANFDEGEDGDEPSVAHSTVTPSQLGELALMQHEGVISRTMAKKILVILFEHGVDGTSPRQVAAEHGMELISSPARLLAMSHDIIVQHPDELQVYCKGGKFIGKMQKLFTSTLR